MICFVCVCVCLYYFIGISRLVCNLFGMVFGLEMYILI